MSTETIHGDKQALETLRRTATTEEDYRELRKWEDEIDEKTAATAKHLGGAPVAHYVEVAGVVETPDAVETARRAGQEVSPNGYDNGRRE